MPLGRSRGRPPGTPRRPRRTTRRRQGPRSRPPRRPSGSRPSGSPRHRHTPRRRPGPRTRRSRPAGPPTRPPAQGSARRRGRGRCRGRPAAATPAGARRGRPGWRAGPPGTGPQCGRAGPRGTRPGPVRRPSRLLPRLRLLACPGPCRGHLDHPGYRCCWSDSTRRRRHARSRPPDAGPLHAGGAVAVGWSYSRRSGHRGLQASGIETRGTVRSSAMRGIGDAPNDLRVGQGSQWGRSALRLR